MERPVMRTETISRSRKKGSIYVIAGEPSGDAIGAHVLRAMRDLDLEISGVGGDKMQIEGLSSLFDIGEISVGGIIEVIPHILRIREIIHLTARDIIDKSPDVVLTIDSPGFCFRVAKMVRKLSPGIRMIHLVAPSVWAWRPRRAKKLAKLYDILLTLFEFEPPYFLKYGLQTEYVGHPMIEEFLENIDCPTQRPLELEFTEGIKDDLLLLMPGSRPQEIKKMLPIFLEFSEKYETSRCVIPTLPHLVPMIREYLVPGRNIEIMTDEDAKHELYRRARLAVVASGTATLQLAIAGCPMIVCYKLHWLTYSMVKLIANTQYISLVNIITNRRIVHELIQGECRAERILQVAQDPAILNQINELRSVRDRICSIEQLPSKRIVNIIMEQSAS
jgi:lipid-A-disaccharide synthase